MIIKWFNKQPVTIRAAVIGAIIVSVSSLVLWLISRTIVEDSRLEIVDVGIVESSVFPKIDIKIRNTGEKAAFLKQANFKVEKIWELFPGQRQLAAIEASEDYSVNLNTGGAPYIVTREISQGIKPNDLDRFTFSLHNDQETDFFRDYVFLLTIELVYDENNKSILTKKLMFMTDIDGLYNCRVEKTGDEKDCEKQFAHNSGVISEIAQIDALKSETLKDFIVRKGGPRPPPEKVHTKSQDPDEIRRITGASGDDRAISTEPSTAPSPGFSQLLAHGRNTPGELIARTVDICATRKGRATPTVEPLINLQRLRCKGTIVNNLGYVLTAGHCVDRAENVEVMLCNGRRVSAEIVLVSGIDFAILKISLSSDDIRELLKRGREEALKANLSFEDQIQTRP